MKFLVPLMLIAVTPALAATPVQGPEFGKETVIRQHAGGAVRKYAAFEPDVLYLQDYRSLWYRAQLSGPCFAQAPYRRGISFRSQGIDTAVDRFATVVRDDGRSCGITSLVRVPELPKGRKSIAGI